LKCPYCSINIPNNAKPKCKESTLGELKEFVINFPLKIRENQLSGGSPEMHPDFVEYTNWLLNQGYYIQVVTNLTFPLIHNKLKKTRRLMLCSTYHHCYKSFCFIKNYELLKKDYRVIVEEIGERPEDKHLSISKLKAYIKPKDMVDNIRMLRVAPDLKIYRNCYDLYKNAE